MKDWIVDVQQKRGGSKSLRDAYSYMKDKNRPSHIRFTEIFVLGNEKAFQNTIIEAESLNQRGRKLDNYATSAMLSIPEDLIHPTQEQWKLISEKLLENFVCEVNSLQDRKTAKIKPDDELIKDWKKKSPDLSNDDIELKLKRKRNDEHRFLNQRLNLDTLKKTTGLIVHDESAGSKASHLNVLISNVQDGEFKKVITQYGGVNALKKAFNQSVQDALGFNNKYYTPKESREPNQPAYDDNTPFKRKELKPETVERGGKKIRKKRRRKKPYSVVVAEKKEQERIKLEAQGKEIIEDRNKLTEKNKLSAEKIKAHNTTLNNKAKIIKTAKQNLDNEKRYFEIDKSEIKRKLKSEKEAFEAEKLQDANDMNNFADGFLEYIHVLQEGKKVNTHYSFKSNFYDETFYVDSYEKALDGLKKKDFPSISDDELKEVAKEKIEIPYAVSMKAYLGDLFERIYSKIFNNKDEFDKKLEQTNEILEKAVNMYQEDYIEASYDNSRKNRNRPRYTPYN